MHDRAPQRHGVEPAAAPAPAGHRAELVADPRQVLAVFIEQLGRKRSRADPRGVGLHDAEHVIEHARSDAGAGGGAAGGGVRRGHERIGADVDIEHRALRAFEHAHWRPALAAAPAPPVTSTSSGRSRSAYSSCSSSVRWKSTGGWREIALQHEVVEVQHLAELGGEAIALEQIGHAHRAARHLVLVGRSDAAAGGADRIDAAGGFARPIERHVRRQDQRTGRRDAQPLEHRHALLDQHRRLRETAPRATAPRRCR